VSSFYVLCPATPTEWHCDLDALQIGLGKRWPGVDVTHSDEQTRAVAWELYLGGPHWLDGSIDQDGEACYLRGSPDLLADFVVWFRELEPVPDLVLVIDTGGTLHPVPVHVTRDEVLAML
jgi:hypothetical protein